MIARIWQGRTKAEDSDAYTALLKQLAIPDYQKAKGFVHLTFLKRISGNEGHFSLITFWENMEVIKNFAGEDIEKAKYYAEDQHYLLEFPETVTHYEVFAN